PSTPGTAAGATCGRSATPLLLPSSLPTPSLKKDEPSPPTSVGIHRCRHGAASGSATRVPALTTPADRGVHAMKIGEIMTRNVQTITPDQSIREAAALMAQVDCGALLVNEGDRLVGVITDRDIAIRAVADGEGPDCPVRQVMTPSVCYCF